jgi:hypothetical protein
MPSRIRVRQFCAICDDDDDDDADCLLCPRRHAACPGRLLQPAVTEGLHTLAALVRKTLDSFGGRVEADGAVEQDLSKIEGVRGTVSCAASLSLSS